MNKVLLVSLGCPKNLVDSEIITGILMDNNYKMTVDVEQADTVIINTCSFIQPAVEEAIDTILKYAKLKREGVFKKLVVAGCLVERYKEDIIDQIDEVDACLGIKAIKDIASLLKEDAICVYGNDYDIDFLNLPRTISGDQPFAYLKIGDGCDNTCTYCTIPSIRGKMQSRNIDEIVKEAVNLEQNGIKEIILVAQDVTAYGLDLYEKYALAELIKKIIDSTDKIWVRLLYCYPESTTDELIELMAKEKRFLSYIDIPLQHGSNKILRLMNRKGTNEEYVALIKKIREKVPELIIRTTFITGFPGENEEDVKILEDFINLIQFDRVGIFTYCLEEGTPATKLPNRVNEEIMVQRKEKLMLVQQDISLKKNSNRLGTTCDILIEDVAADGIFYMGRSYGEAPDIDGVVYVTSRQPLSIGDIIEVTIVNVEQYDLIGEAINEFTQ